MFSRILLPGIEHLITYNQPVLSIDYSGDGVKVICDSEIIQCDSVIVTCSVGYLNKHAGEMFTPPLPPAKQRALKEFGFGVVNKLFLKFDKPFWNKDCDGLQLLWTDEWASDLEEELLRIPGVCGSL